MKLNYAGLCALIAVGTVGLAVILAVAGMIWRDTALGEPAAGALDIAVGGLVAIGAAYIGRRGSGQE